MVKLVAQKEARGKREQGQQHGYDPMPVWSLLNTASAQAYLYSSAGLHTVAAVPTGAATHTAQATPGCVVIRSYSASLCSWEIVLLSAVRETQSWP